MATNKNALTRYLALDKCFGNRSRKFTADDLLEACNEALRYLDPKSKGIKRRQLYEDIKFMASDSGWQIEFEENAKDGRVRYYRYADPDFSINKSALNSTEAAQLSEVVSMLARFSGRPQFVWMDELLAKLESNFGLKQPANKIIDFDENKDYMAVKFISPLFNAILNKTVLTVSYKSFKSDREQEFVFHPYYLKQYNNRWFCFGYSEGSSKITNLALDRIQNIKNKKAKYHENTDIDFNEYFEEVIGVTVPDNVPAQKVVLKIESSLWPYIQSKPIHGTQKTIKKDSNHVIVSIEVKPNYELQSLILSHGERMEIIEPKDLRETILNRVSKINEPTQ